MNDIFNNYRDKIIEDGLREVCSLLPKQEGVNAYFYMGSRDGFIKCVGKNLEELEELYKESLEKRSRAFNKHLENKDDSLLNEYWRANGECTQIEFVLNLVKPFFE